ncbi:hypothetical protein F4818DRAFT_116859 [Hypoxylon cercidicola]|nr:hypothetical protein F4818DRAFT_116859 [Hypoxylon cercidicola]
MSDESDIEDGVADEPLFNSFIDAEAAESDELDESDDLDEIDLPNPSVSFPQFMHLPPELRERVWEFFVPDLKGNRVLRFLHQTHLGDELWESSFLSQQTAPARTMLATNSESRAIALKNQPDTIELRGGRGILRFHSERDVILIGTHASRPRDPDRFASLLRNVKYLAIDSTYYSPKYTVSIELPFALLQHLKAIFLGLDCHSYRKSKLGWCTSDSVHQYQIQEVEELEGTYLSTDINYLYCWPDLQKAQDLAKNVHPGPEDYSGVPVWPMIEFVSHRGLDRYQKVCDLVSGQVEGQDDSSGSDSQSEDGSISGYSTVDEYESEGIDDATIDSDGDAAEDEDDLVVQSGSGEEEHEDGDEEQDVSVFNGFSPLQDEEPELHLDDEVGVANFSSLEPESPNHDGNESSRDITDEEPVRTTVRQKRRIVLSDDEHDSGDEADEIPSRPAKRSRIVLSDTEDEDDEDGKGGDQVVEGNGHHPVDESEDDEVTEEEVEDPDETEDEEPVKTKPMSIFEKLRQFRDDNPVPQQSDDDSHTEGSVDPDEFDDGSDAHFLDDEAMDELDLVEQEDPEGEGEEEWY